MAKKQVKEIIHAKGLEIAIYTDDFKDEFISLTDIAKYSNSEYASDVINNWMRNRNTVEYLGIWEKLYNVDFNSLEFEGIEKEAGKNSFVLSPKKWIETTNAIGMTTKAGRYAATFAHKDIALKFASWLSPEFELYIIKDYQRLKSDESSRLSLNWNLNRELSKLNYRIHTDAIKEHIIPQVLSAQQIGITYASEADVLNVALFGKTARQWRDENPKSKGNMRDDATLNQLLVLANMENYNAILIEQGISQPERLQLINSLAIKQLQTIENVGVDSIKRLERK
ncbi:MAG: KilA-N domain-containing protein [Streptococcaceae bacterium]|nr:KilA-N domain-containing protein [Streptococcaceae bacterium]